MMQAMMRAARKAEALQRLNRKATVDDRLVEQTAKAAPSGLVRIKRPEEQNSTPVNARALYGWALARVSSWMDVLSSAALRAVSSVKSSRSGVIEIHPFSTAQRSVPSSAFSKRNDCEPEMLSSPRVLIRNPPRNA
jgi:hypothetical protein